MNSNFKSKLRLYHELELSTTKVPPIHSYGNFASLEATLLPILTNCHGRNLKIYFVYNFSTSSFALPFLVILEMVDLDYTQSKFWKNRLREFEIVKKSNLANAKSPIQEWQFG